MLFPPRGAKIRSVFESVLLPAEPFLLSGYDEGRIVLVLYVGEATNDYPIIARTHNGIYANAGLTDYQGEIAIYGPEEIWVAQTGGGGTLTEAAFTYQALYWA